MGAVESWGLTLVHLLQQLSPALDAPMRFLSLLGSEEAYIFVVVLLYWCVDARWGARALGILLVSAFVNDLVKLAFHAPRPYWIDPQVRALSLETSYGVPSGHAEIGIAFCGYHAVTIGRRWAWVGAVLLVLAISLSRIYLGVHFPHDVVAGWMIGVSVLAAYAWVQPRVAAWIDRRPPVAQAVAVVAVSLVLLPLTLGSRALLGTTVDPPAWASQARVSAGLAGNPEHAIDPRSLASPIAVLGTMLGAGVGLVLARRSWPRRGRASWVTRLARLVVGFIGLLVLRAGLAAVFPTEPETPSMLFRYLQYAVMGLWTMWLAPVVFVRAGLTSSGARP